MPKGKTHTTTTDRDVLLRVGWPLVQEFYDNCCSRERRPFVREKLWDATVDAFLHALSAYDGRGEFEAFFYMLCWQRWSRVRQTRRWRKEEDLRRPLTEAVHTRTISNGGDDDFACVNRADSMGRLMSVLHGPLQRLTAWEREVVTRYYGIGRPEEGQAAIGASRNVTRTAANRGVRRAVRKLRSEIQCDLY